MLALNLALRFLLELAGIAALAAWGWTIGGGGAIGAVVAVVAAGALVVTWARVVAPRARNAIPLATRMLIGTALLLGCAALLALAGQAVPAAGFALVNVLNTAVLVGLGASGEVARADRVPDPSRRS